MMASSRLGGCILHRLVLQFELPLIKESEALLSVTRAGHPQSSGSEQAYQMRRHFQVLVRVLL